VVVAGREWSPTANPYGYTTRELDPESLLLHYRLRTYSPTLRQFLQRDPLGYASGPDPYEYVGSQPLQSVDPRGEKGIPFSCKLCIASAAADLLGGGIGCALGCGQEAPQRGYSVQRCIAQCFWMYLNDRLDSSQALNRFKNIIEGTLCTWCGLDILDIMLAPPSERPPSEQPEAPPGPDIETDGPPPFEGPPGGRARQRDGQKEREYGPDGWPKKDIEPSSPTQPAGPDGRHAHDWERPPDGGRPTHKHRGPPYPYYPPCL